MFFKNDKQAKKLAKKLKTINNYFFDKGIDDINNGHCYHWAMIAYRLLGGSLCFNEGHAFIKKYDKYYDSTSLEGEFDPFDLETNRRCHLMGWEALQEDSSEDEFKDYWSQVGRYDWDDNLIEEFFE